MSTERTTDPTYTDRLVRLQRPLWKRVLDVQRPYRWNLRRLQLGTTLDVGCGIGRCLKDLPRGSVGIDHNRHSIQLVEEMGLPGFLPEEFLRSAHAKAESFDTLLFSHVLEHLTPDAAGQLLRQYLTFLRPGGRIVLICPQEKGFATDSSHMHFFDIASLRNILTDVGLTVTQGYSFPLPRFMGTLFAYNESVVIGTKL